MAAIGTLPVLFATGVHGSRPAASAVGKGGLYSCTTHSLVYQTDGSSWSTWATLGGTTTDLAFTRYQRTAGTYSTTSTSFADVDGTNLSRSITTTGNLVLIIVSGSYESDVANDTCGFDIDIDGAREGGTFGLMMTSSYGANRATNMSFVYTKSGLSAASHTFKLQWRRVSGTGTQSLHGNSSTVPLTFTVLELYVS